VPSKHGAEKMTFATRKFGLDSIVMTKIFNAIEWQNKRNKLHMS
jgi:hypothetical protein